MSNYDPQIYNNFLITRQFLQRVKYYYEKSFNNGYDPQLIDELVKKKELEFRSNIRDQVCPNIRDSNIC